MNISEAATSWQRHREMHASMGLIMPDVVSYMTPAMKADYHIALDAAPPGLTTAPNASVPSILTTYLDPELVRVLFAPVAAANIMEERKVGDWTMDTYMVPVVEATGEVSSYGDYNENGRTGVNVNFPQRQSYHFQTISEYGERELERAGLTKMNLIAEIDAAAVETLKRFSNYSYFFGVGGNLRNYGLLNDPSLPAALTPATKAAGGARWMTVGNAINATANEVYADIEALFAQLVSQTTGLVKQTDEMILAMSPTSAVALTATNSFNVNVSDLLKKNFPNMRVETAVQYGAASSTNPEGVAAGNFVQLIAKTLEGKSVGFLGFTEKLRAHKMEVRTSSYKQKKTSGTWGAIIKFPLAISSMVGI